MPSKFDHIKAPRVQPLAYQSAKGLKEGIIYKDIPVYNVIFAGHVDAGKSTLVGELLIATKLVSQHTIDQFKKIATPMGKGSFSKAWVTDIHLAEREKGVTMDIAHVELFTGNRYYTLIDSPGHVDYMKNMITGASQADLLALIVDAPSLYDNLKNWEINNEIQTNPILNLNSIEHATTCRGFGIDRTIIVLNKYDLIPEEKREEAFLYLQAKLGEVLSRDIGFKTSNISWCPASAGVGMGILQAFPGINSSTSKGLLKDLDEVDLGIIPSDLPLRMSVEGVLKEVSGTNVVVTGKVQSGILKPKDQVILKPMNIKATVRTIQMHRKELTFAGPGYNIGVDLKSDELSGSIEELKRKIGKNTILAHIGSAPSVVEKFTAKAVIKKITATSGGLMAGRSKVVVHTKTGAMMSCLISEIRNPIELATKLPLKNIELGPNGEVPAIFTPVICELVLIPDEAIVIEDKATHPKNCHITIRESNETLGWGSVVSVIPSRYEVSTNVNTVVNKVNKVADKVNEVSNKVNEVSNKDNETFNQSLTPNESNKISDKIKEDLDKDKLGK